MVVYENPLFLGIANFVFVFQKFPVDCYISFDVNHIAVNSHAANRVLLWGAKGAVTCIFPHSSPHSDLKGKKLQYVFCFLCFSSCVNYYD